MISGFYIVLCNGLSEAPTKSNPSSRTHFQGTIKPSAASEDGTIPKDRVLCIMGTIYVNSLLPSTGGLALMSINLTPTVWLAWLILGTLVFVNSTLNPILYCWRIKGLRRAVVKIVRQMFCLAF